MIIDNTTVNVEKSGNFESTDFRIDAKYKNKVLWMLINQYRHKVRTPVQEIISNARDAQRENGNPEKAIKIQLPTKIEPTFIVRDFGVGMDENRIKTIFTSFGASTKNADNSQTGGFGIGAKSPLAYTDSFNIKTYVDGKYWFYVIAKTKDDGIGINLLDTGKTTEENGTEVQIPVKPNDSREFNESACRCTMFWDVKPEFNLDDEDLYKVDGGTKISDTFTIYTSNNLGGMFNSELIVLVDGIPYEIDHKTKRDIKALREIEDTLNYNSRAVFTLNTGDIDLLQTRESIEDTEKTTAKLTEMASKELENLNLYLESCFTDKSLEGRIKQYMDVSNKFSRVRDHKFDIFTINIRHFYINNKLYTLEYNYEGKTGRVVTPQRHLSANKHSGNYFRHADIGKFYYDDLKDAESDTMKNRRMRNHLTVNNEKSIVVKQGAASNFEYMRTLRLLKAKKLSSLELPAKIARVKGAKKAKAKKPDTILVHKLSGNYRRWDSVTRYSRDVKLKTNEEKYVYVEYSASNEYMNSHNFIEMLENEYDMTACRIADSKVKIIKDDKNFIHIDKFMADFKPTKKIITSLAEDLTESNYKEEAKLIIAKGDIIFDKVLLKMAHHVTIDTSYIRVPSLISELLADTHNLAVQNKAKIIEKFDARIKEKYPLLSHRNLRKENVNYINSRRK